MNRDLSRRPYTFNERRVCDYILEITKNTIGCGDDPVGFLIASHAVLSKQPKAIEEALEREVRKHEITRQSLAALVKIIESGVTLPGIDDPVMEKAKRCIAGDFSEESRNQ